MNNLLLPNFLIYIHKNSILLHKSDPKRLRKVLPKAMKTIKQGDRVLLIGCTHAPFDAKVKPLCKLYDRIILLPRPDYASRYRKSVLNFSSYDPLLKFLK